MNTARRTVALLSASQALLLTNGVTLMAVNGLAGLALAPDRRLATLPIMAYVVGAALTTLPASFCMKRYGRRAGFSLGALFGIAGAAIGAFAVWMASFWLLCAGTLVSGIYNAFGQYYRFAAADAAPSDFKGTAISLTLAGGIFGGLLGPELSKWTRDLVQPPFLASYAALAGVGLVALALSRLLTLPAPVRAESEPQGRPLRDIARQPGFAVAVTAGAVAYLVMNLLMSATPLAMDLCGHPFSDAVFVLQWHVLGMFFPSFFTGSLIKRMGVLPVLLAGAALMFACVGIATGGTSVSRFWWALTLLGIGWNFLYVGGTALLTETYRPEERAKVQGVNDFVIFLSQAASAALSGVVVTSAGWSILNLLALPLLLLTSISTAACWLRRTRRVAT